MRAYAELAARYGNVDAGNDAAVNTFLRDVLPTLPEKTIESFLSDLLVVEGMPLNDDAPTVGSEFSRDMHREDQSQEVDARLEHAYADWKRLSACLTGLHVTPEQIQAANLANVEALFAAARIEFNAAQRFASINAEATRHMFEEATKLYRMLAEVQKPEEMLQLRDGLAPPAIAKSVEYSKRLYDVASKMNAELAEVAERHIAEWSANFGVFLDKDSGNVPGPIEVGPAVRAMIDAANAAYDNLSKTARQATDIAERNAEALKGWSQGKKVA